MLIACQSWGEEGRIDEREERRSTDWALASGEVGSVTTVSHVERSRTKKTECSDMPRLLLFAGWQSCDPSRVG